MVVLFFKEVKSLNLVNSSIVAFGSTRRAGSSVSTDPQIQALISSGAPVVTIVGKASLSQVETVLETSTEENLSMIKETIEYLKAHSIRVIFDAEHFFDGFAENPEYALKCVSVAAQSGAEYVVLCDTNGGTLPVDVFNATHRVVREVGNLVGIHCHNDSDVAVANSIAAVQAGAKQVQGTINGYGERCGNTDLTSVIPNLQLKKGYNCLPPDGLKNLFKIRLKHS